MLENLKSDADADAVDCCAKVRTNGFRMYARMCSGWIISALFLVGFCLLSIGKRWSYRCDVDKRIISTCLFGSVLYILVWLVSFVPPVRPLLLQFDDFPYLIVCTSQLRLFHASYDVCVCKSKNKCSRWCAFLCSMSWNEMFNESMGNRAPLVYV